MLQVSLYKDGLYNDFLTYKHYISAMKSIVVFCGSSEGYNEVYKETGYQLGASLSVGMRLYMAALRLA